MFIHVQKFFNEIEDFIFVCLRVADTKKKESFMEVALN